MRLNFAFEFIEKFIETMALKFGGCCSKPNQSLSKNPRIFSVINVNKSWALLLLLSRPSINSPKTDPQRMKNVTINFQCSCMEGVIKISREMLKYSISVSLSYNLFYIL